MDRIDQAIVRLARSGKLFTADDVRAMVGTISRPNLIGSRFHAARELGLIVTQGVEQSYRRSRRGATVYRWRGKTPLDPGGRTEEENLATREKDKQLQAMQKVIDTLADFSRKERAAILQFVLERFDLGAQGQQIEAEERAKAKKAEDQP